MRFDQLETFIKECDYKVGTPIGGFVIEEILPIPINYINEYLLIYRRLLAAEATLAAFCKEMNLDPLKLDYGVIAVCNKAYLENDGLLSYFILSE